MQYALEPGYVRRYIYFDRRWDAPDPGQPSQHPRNGPGQCRGYGQISVTLNRRPSPRFA